jgi:hypothetical protein
MAGGFPLDTRVELDLGGWTDVTGRVYARDPISITRGKAPDATSSDPVACKLTFDNRDDAFSMRNPLGPYYGLLRRNVPVRVSLPAEVPGMRVQYNDPTRDKESGAFTPGVGLASTGDLDLRVEIDADQWSRGQLIGKYEAVDGLREWLFFVDDGGRLVLQWSPDGLTTNQKVAESGALFGDNGPAHRAVRAVLALADGSVTFYLAPTLAGPWTAAQTVSGAGATSIVASDTGIAVGQIFALTGQALPGRVVGAEVRRGGVLIASPDFGGQPPGTLSFSDAQGNTWALGADAEITDRDVRFLGEVSQWPQSRDVAGVDKTIAVTAYGIRRRLELNAPELDSVMVREFASPKRTAIVAYWPMEDAEGASSLASAFPGAPPMHITGAPELGTYTDWHSSKALPKVQTGAFAGAVPGYDWSTGVIRLRWFMDMDTAPTVETGLVLLRTSTLVWKLTTDNNGAIRVRALSTDGGTTYMDSGFVQFHLNTLGFCSVDFLTQQVGANVAWTLQVLDFQSDQVYNQLIPGTSFQGTVNNRTVGRATSITVAQDGTLGDVAFGHLAVGNTTGAYANTSGALNTWNGEQAEGRLARLSREDGVTVRVDDGGGLNGYTNGHRLGDQVASTWTGILDDAEASDLGMLCESREELGFVYRTRWGLTNQAATVALDYDAGEIARDLEPVDDDQALINDVTVTATNGGSARAEDTDSPLSVLAPPDGVGRYADSVEISAQSDEWLPSQAAFRVRLGTVDEARYPSLEVDLHSPRVSADKARAVRRLDVGDRVDILNADPWTAAVPQIVTGYTETLQVVTHTFAFNLTPYAPWTAAVVETDRYDTAGSELASPAAPIVPAPDFVAKAETYWNAAVVPATLPAGGDFLVACIAWNSTADFTAVPAGWTLVDRLTGVSASAAVYTAPGTVTNATWSFAAATKTSVVILGYSGATLEAHVPLLDAGTDGVHEAPAINVTAAPARVVRFYWEKSSQNTLWTANDAGAMVRGIQYGTGSGSASVLATDQVASAPGTVASASALANVSTSQAGGFSLALLSTAPPDTSDGSITETDTTFTVATTLGPRWTTNPADFPLDVMCGGERMRVTAISGTDPAGQTFTAERGVNGIAKAHTVGTAVALADPAFVAL